MGCCHGHLPPITISLLFFLILSSTQVRFMVEGRLSSKLMETSKEGVQVDDNKEEKIEITERVMIGSRPPRCEMKCNSCRHCEAVQVPAVPQEKKIKTHNNPNLSTTSISVSMRGDDNSSNYKPMSWKCKCGDMIFNP